MFSSGLHACENLIPWTILLQKLPHFLYVPFEVGIVGFLRFAAFVGMLSKYMVTVREEQFGHKIFIRFCLLFSMESRFVFLDAGSLTTCCMKESFIRSNIFISAYVSVSCSSSLKRVN